MSNYKRATLEEEEVSDAPAEAASSPDRMEVSKCSKHKDQIVKDRNKYAISRVSVEISISLIGSMPDQ